MPITRCPRCGTRQLIDQHVLGRTVACVRCDGVFAALSPSRWSAGLQWTLACAALAAGIAVRWYTIRGHW